MARRSTKTKKDSMPTVMDNVEIEVSKVLYQGKGNWTIILFDTTDKTVLKYRSIGIDLKAVGWIQNAEVGAKYRTKLKLESNEYGYQFTIKEIKAIEETAEIADNLRDTIMSLTDFESRKLAFMLANGMIPFVGPAATLKAIQKYGNKLSCVIPPKHTIFYNREDIFGNKKANDSFYEDYAEVEKYASLNAFFQGRMSFSRIQKLYELLEKNPKAEEAMRKDPFILVGTIRGFTYRYINGIVKQLKLPNYQKIYFRAAIQEALRLLSMQGDCFGSEREIVAQLQDLLEGEEEFDEDKFENTLCELIDEGKIVVWDNDIYLKKMFCDEQIVGKFFRMNDVMCQTCSNEEVEELIREEEEISGFQYEATQKKAVYSMNSRKVSIVTGGPGTGKSTVINLMVKLWLSKGYDESSVVLLAPTGKAAQRMADIVGLEAFTIHKWVSMRAFSYTNEDMLYYLKKPDMALEEPEKLVIIDETSMLDISIAAWMLKAIGFNAKIVLVGDGDQLPSIGPGLVLKDLMNKIVTTRLQIQHRSVPSITWNAQQFNMGRAKDLMFDEHFKLICLDDDQEPNEVIQEEYKKIIDKYGLEHVSLLCPKRKESSNPKSVTAANLNKYFQGIFHKKEEPSLEGFYVGDRVIQCKNNYKLSVFNGEVGTVKKIKGGILYVCMDGDHRIVEYDGLAMEHLDLAYAISVHKSQGSEFSACVIPVLNADMFMLQRNLIYTAVTRCKQEVVLITNKKGKPLHVGVYKNPTEARNTNLSQY